MATTIVNPPSGNDSSGNGLGFLLGIIALAVFVIIFIVYLLPIIQNGIGGGTQVNVPKDINVNVEQKK